jgi:hypothetical protein
MLYDVIARKEYRNIITVVAASPSRSCTMGSRRRRTVDLP